MRSKTGVTKLRAGLALLRGGPSGTRQEGPQPSAIPSGQPGSERRSHRRLTVAEVPFISQVRLKFGPAVMLIDISAGGAQIETTNVGLQPGSMVTLEMTGQHGKRAIPAQVLRCQLASLRPELVYRVTLVFTRPVDLKELGADSVEPVADDLEPGARVGAARDGCLQVWHSTLPGASRRQTSWRPWCLTLWKRRSRHSTPLPVDVRGQRWPRHSPASSRRRRTCSARRRQRPRSSPRSRNSSNTLCRREPFATPRPFCRSPGSQAILFAIPSLDSATPVGRLAIEFADGCEPLEWHLQILKAGVQLIAIARELGRLHGCDRPLLTSWRPAADSVAADVVIPDDRRPMPDPIASSDTGLKRFASPRPSTCRAARWSTDTSSWATARGAKDVSSSSSC